MKTKIVKLLPVALALMLISPAFAEEGAAASKTATSTQIITVPKFINITHDPASVESAGAQFNGTYSVITLDKSMNTQFHVVTNNPDEAIKLTATCLAGGNQVNALYGADAQNLRLIFTNNGTDKRAAEATAVTNIMGEKTAIAQNANAIAFTLTPTFAVDSTSGGTTPTATLEAGGEGIQAGVKYRITNGAYNFNYTVGTTAMADTFSTHDTDGTYKATLTLSQVSP